MRQRLVALLLLTGIRNACACRTPRWPPRAWPYPLASQTRTRRRLRAGTWPPPEAVISSRIGVRHRQLTRLDSRQPDCSLVGCSPGGLCVPRPAGRQRLFAFCPLRRYCFLCPAYEYSVMIPNLRVPQEERRTERLRNGLASGLAGESPPWSVVPSSQAALSAHPLRPPGVILPHEVHANCCAPFFRPWVQWKWACFSRTRPRVLRSERLATVGGTVGITVLG